MVKKALFQSERPGVAGTAELARPPPARAMQAAVLLLVRDEVYKLRRRYEEFDRDILLPILLGEIALHNIGALENAADTASEGQSRSRGARAMRPCNTYSIAAATDLPRETVRRKIGSLVERGWIHRHDNGHLFVTAAALKHFGTQMEARELPELLELAERVRKLVSA